MVIRDEPLAKAVRLREGTVLMPRRPREGEPVPERQMFWQIFPHGLYDALRWAMHVDVGYLGTDYVMGEVEQLEEAQDALVQILTWLDSSPPLDEEDREALSSFLQGMAGGLGRVQDERKVRAVLRLLQARSEQDRLKRRNPSARMAVMAGAANDLSCRLELVQRILPRIGQRAIAMAIEAERIQRVFRYVYKEIDRLVARLQAGTVQKRQMWPVVGDLITRLLTVRIGPYPTHIKRLTSDLDIARKRKTTDERVQYLTKARESLRFKKARWVLEEILMRLSLWVHSKTLPPEDAVASMRGEIVSFRQRLAGLDDSGFTVPVVSEVDVALDAALNYLKPSELKQAKDLIQKAAQRL